MAFGAHSELMQEGDGAGVLLTPGSSLWGSGFQSQDTRERQPATMGQSGTRTAGGWDSMSYRKAGTHADDLGQAVRCQL